MAIRKGLQVQIRTYLVSEIYRKYEDGQLLDMVI